MAVVSSSCEWPEAKTSSDSCSMALPAGSCATVRSVGGGGAVGERFSVNVQGINVANRRVLLDNSFTFGGTHYLNPHEIFVQLRFHFHY
jgi:hypothetical protein